MMLYNTAPTLTNTYLRSMENQPFKQHKFNYIADFIQSQICTLAVQPVISAIYMNSCNKKYALYSVILDKTTALVASLYNLHSGPPVHIPNKAS